MPAFVDHETNALQAAKESGAEVRLIFTNGYQTLATIENYNCEVIMARVRGERWMVYKGNLSTIVLD